MEREGRSPLVILAHARRISAVFNVLPLTHLYLGWFVVRVHGIIVKRYGRSCKVTDLSSAAYPHNRKRDTGCIRSRRNRNAIISGTSPSGSPAVLSQNLPQTITCPEHHEPDVDDQDGSGPTRQRGPPNFNEMATMHWYLPGSGDVALPSVAGTPVSMLFHWGTCVQFCAQWRFGCACLSGGAICRKPP